MLFEFVKPLVGPKSVQYANGPSGREVHRAMASAFSHQACADALPKGASLYNFHENLVILVTSSTKYKELSEIIPLSSVIHLPQTALPTISGTRHICSSFLHNYRVHHLLVDR